MKREIHIFMGWPQNKNKEETRKKKKKKKEKSSDMGYPAVNLCKYLYFQGHHFWFWYVMLLNACGECKRLYVWVVLEQLISSFCIIYELICFWKKKCLILFFLCPHLNSIDFCGHKKNYPTNKQMYLKMVKECIDKTLFDIMDMVLLL